MASTAYLWNASTASWQNVKRNTYFTGFIGQQLITHDEEWDTTSHAWLLKARHTYSYDLAGNIVAHLFENYQATNNSFDTSYIESYGFNTYKQLTSHARFYWQSGQWVVTAQSEMELYYYESLLPSSVSNMAIADFDLKLFPIPATDLLSFSIFGKEKKVYQSCITDVQGRVYDQRTFTVSGLFKGEIDTRRMPSGQYLLTIRDASGTSLSRKVLITH
jgi:hypothetical protein